MPTPSSERPHPRRRRSHLRRARKSKIKKPGLFARLLQLFRIIRFRRRTDRASDKQQIPQILISPLDDRPDSVVATTGGTLDHEREATLPISTKVSNSKTSTVNTESREVVSRFITASSDDDFQTPQDHVDFAVVKPDSAPVVEDEWQLREQLESKRPDSIQINKKRIKASCEDGCNSALAQPRVASCGNRQQSHDAPFRSHDCGGVQFQQIPEIIEAPSYPYRNDENSPA